MTKLMATVTMLLAVVVQTPAAFAACGGDCSGDGEVTVDELVLGVNIALGSATLSQCTSFDSSGDGEVTIDELVSAVNSALNGCNVGPNPTATATPTSPTTLPTPTPTSGIVPPGISTQMLGTFGGTAVNESTHVSKPARMKIEVVGSTIMVTDLLANIFVSGPTIPVSAPVPTTITSSRPIVGFIEVFNLSLVPDGSLAGIYSTTTLTFPPNVNAVALILFRES